jgi:hypothetical protein
VIAVGKRGLMIYNETSNRIGAAPVEALFMAHDPVLGLFRVRAPIAAFWANLNAPQPPGDPAAPTKDRS